MRPILILSLLLLGAVPSGDDLDAAIRRQLDREHVPALTFAVVRHGNIVRQGAYGFANLEWRTPATIHTKFEAASVSKMFVGAAVRILIEEGRLDLEDSIGKYFENIPESWKGMRLRHLITMSSGLPEDWGSDLIPYNQDVATAYDDASMLRAFFTLKMAAPTGSRFVYCSPGYDMLAMIVAKITGKPFSEFVRERIFTPAGMSESSYIDNAAIVPERAEGYRKDQSGVLKKGRFLGQYLHARPDDGVLTTPGDLARWVIALEQRRIVKAPDALWQPTIADSGRPLDYAYGWMNTTWLGHRRVEHSGGLRTGFHSFVARYPDDDLTVIVTTNCDFSAIRNYVSLLTRKYLPDAPDLERAAPDSDPAATEKLVAALRHVIEGSIDESVFALDAAEPIGFDEVAGFLKQAGAFTYAGRWRVKAQGLQVHGRVLVDYVTLRTEIDRDAVYLTFYHDANGKVALIELTN